MPYVDRQGADPGRDPQSHSGGTAAARPRSLSVVIPAYNEEQRLSRTLASVHGWLRKNGWDFEILAVNDGSLDATGLVANAFAAGRSEIRVLNYPLNHGKGFAVREGVLAALKPAVLFMDADNATPIGEVERLWPHLESDADVVIASRRMPGAELLRPQPFHRRVMGHVFRGIVSLAGLRNISDTQCGFKLFSRAAARLLFGQLRTRGFAFDVEILLRARRCGLRIREAPIRWTDDIRSHVRPVRDALRMATDVLRIWSRA